jgi:long-subunit fatty acid transport protein
MTCLDMALPQTASAGVRYIARDDAGRELGDLELDVRWENWAAVDRYHVVMDGKNSALDTPVNATVVRHGFQDVYSVRVGGSRRLGSELQYLISLGLGYETAAAPVSWTRLDVDTAERIIAAGGVAIDLGSWRLDLGVEFIDPHDRRVYDQPVADPSDMRERVQPDVSVPLADPESQPYHPFNAGTYASQYLIGSAGLTATW